MIEADLPGAVTYHVLYFLGERIINNNDYVDVGRRDKIASGPGAKQYESVERDLSQEPGFEFRKRFMEYVLFHR